MKYDAAEVLSAPPLLNILAAPTAMRGPCSLTSYRCIILLVLRLPAHMIQAWNVGQSLRLLQQRPPHYFLSTRLYVSPTPTAAKAIMMYPRAAAAVTVQCGSHYLLVQRGKPPGQGTWSLPGGKMEMGETALEAAQRELEEEVKFDPPLIDNLHWYSGPFTTSDVIARDAKGVITFHYLIAQCFCRVVQNNASSSSLPLVSPDDDAADAKWWTLDEIKHNQASISSGVVTVIERAELLSEKGALL